MASFTYTTSNCTMAFTIASANEVNAAASDAPVSATETEAAAVDAPGCGHCVTPSVATDMGLYTCEHKRSTYATSDWEV